MKILSIIICVVMTTFQLDAQNLVQNTSKTKVVFKIKNLGVNVDGKFSKIKIESNFNANDLPNSFLNATIPVKTVDTNNSSRNKSLRSDDYFDVENYPNIKLTSTKIEKTGSNTYKLTGKLTVKKTTKTVTLSLIVTENDDSITMISNFDLNRINYDVGGSSWVMSKKVKVTVNYVAKKQH